MSFTNGVAAFTLKGGESKTATSLPAGTSYANQTHHQKVNGEQPGKNICKKTYTIKELSESLGICKECVVEAMRKHHIRMITVNGQFRVNRKDYDEWYASQSHYRNQQDREHDKVLKAVSLTVPEIARMLGVDSWTAWFRIAKDSF